MATALSNQETRPRHSAPRLSGRWLDRIGAPLVLAAILSLMGLALSEFSAPPPVSLPAAQASA